VGLLEKFLWIEFAAEGDFGDNLLPQVLEEGFHLLAIGGAHPVTGEHFDGGLVFADAGGLHADAVFFESLTEEGALSGQAVERNKAKWVEEKVVCCGHEVVVPQAWAGGVGVNRFVLTL